LFPRFDHEIDFVTPAGTQPLASGFDKERNTEESEAPMTDPIRTSVRPNPANTEALHNGDTLDAAGITLTAPRRHGGTHGARATDHFTSSTPSGAADTIRRATRPDWNATAAYQNRENARRALAQLDQIPMPQDPRTNMPPRPAQTLQQMINSQHNDALDAAVASVIGNAIPIVGGMAANHVANEAGRFALRTVEHGGGGAINLALVNRAQVNGPPGGWHQGAIEGAADTVAEQLQWLVMHNVEAPGLLQGAVAQGMSVAHIVEDVHARVGLAQQWSAYDRARNENNENERMGRMTATAQVNLMKRGEITGLTEADLHRAATDFAYRTQIQSLLRQWTNGG
jgi:hypothetical protein